MPNIFRGFYNRETLFFVFFQSLNWVLKALRYCFGGPVGSGRLMIWKISVLLFFLGGRDLIFDPESIL
jgi:hypothetical protein